MGVENLASDLDPDRMKSRNGSVPKAGYLIRIHVLIKWISLQCFNSSKSFDFRAFCGQVGSDSPLKTSASTKNQSFLPSTQRILAMALRSGHFTQGLAPLTRLFLNET